MRKPKAFLIEQQAARIAELERDAGRYRWIRLGNFDSVSELTGRHPAGGYSPDVFDKEVDEALAADAGEPL